MRFKLVILLLLFCTQFESVGNTRRTIVIGGQSNNAPLSFINEKGEPDGFSVQITKAIMNNLKLNYRIELCPFVECYHKLENGDFDLMMGLVYTYPRAEKLRFSTAYITFGYDIVSRNNAVVKDLSDLKNKHVIVKNASAVYEYFVDSDIVNPDNIIRVASYSQGLKMLSQGFGDVAIIGSLSSREIITREALTDLTVAKADIATQEFGFASNDRVLIRVINSEINNLMKSGTYDDLYYGWFGRSTSNKSIVFLYVLIAIVAFIAIFFALRAMIIAAKMRISDGKIAMAYKHIHTLNRSVVISLNSTNTKIFMREVLTDQLYVFVDGNYEPTDLSSNIIEKDIHPDDLRQYCLDYSDFINGVVDNVVSKMRIYDHLKQSYGYYEFVVTAVEKDSNGKVIKYIFTRRDETAEKELIAKQREDINSLKLAIRSGKLLRWYFNPQTKESRLIDENNIEIVFYPNLPGNQLNEENRTSLIEYVNKIINGEFDSNEVVVIQANKDGSEVIYEISGSIEYDAEQRPMFYGIWKNITEASGNRLKIEELQKRISLALEVGQMSAWQFDCAKDIFTNIYGPSMSVEGVIEKRILTEIIHPDDREYVVDVMSYIMRGELDSSTIKFRVIIENSIRWWLCSFVAVKTKGKVKYITGIRRDITEEIEAKNALKKANKLLEMNNERLSNSYENLNKIFDKMPIPLYIKEIDTLKYSYFNDEAIKLFGNHVNEDASGLFSYQDYIRHNENDAKVIATGEDYIGSEIVTLIDGTVLDTHACKQIINIEGVKKLMIVRIDMTERKKMVDELKNAKEKAEESERLKMSFLANMSHEIRTPLNAIVGFSDLLIDAEDVEDRKEYGSIISANSDLLLNLINDILDLSKIDSGFLDIVNSEFDVNKVFDDAYSSINVRVHDDVILSYNKPNHQLIIDFDRKRLVQILNNFLSNAVKYTPNGYIRFGYELIKDGLKIYVSDSGIGISDKNKPKLFTRFEKFDDFAQGTGLGLSICKAIVEKIGGEIGVDSVLNEGSTFWATFPCKILHK